MSDEKPYDPTSHKLAEERKRGNVPFSADLAKLGPIMLVFVVLGLGSASFWLKAPEVLRDRLTQAVEHQQSCEDAIRRFAGSSGHGGAGPGMAARGLTSLSWDFGLMLVLLAAVLGAVGLSLAQTRLAVKPASSGARQLNPVGNLKRLFGAENLWIGPMQTILKLLVVATVVGFSLLGEWGRLQRSSTTSPAGIGRADVEAGIVARRTTDSLMRLCGISLGVLGVLALVDYRIKYASFMKGLRMSHQELVDEHKQLEGNPEVKHLVREMGEEMATVRFNRAISETALITVNPTHFAVGISAARAGRAPRITVKAADREALKLRSMATKKGRPVIRDVEGTRRLYAMALDDPVPEDMLVALEETMRVLESRGLIKRRPQFRLNS